MRGIVPGMDMSEGFAGAVPAGTNAVLAVTAVVVVVVGGGAAAAADSVVAAAVDVVEGAEVAIPLG